MKPTSMRHLSRRERLMRKKAVGLQAIRVERVNLKLVLQRARGVCGICHQPLDLSIAGLDFDHIVPLARGGSHTNDNLQATHTSCNRSKRAG